MKGHPEVIDCLKELLRGELAIDDAFVRAALDPLASVNARTTPGGTAPGEVRRMAGTLDADRRRDRASIDAWRTAIDTAAARLAGAVGNLAA